MSHHGLTGNATDVLLPTAPANVVRDALLPLAFGSSCQLLLAGLATARALPRLRRRYPIPGARQLLVAAVFLNLACAVAMVWQICDRMTMQDRSSLAVASVLRLPDICTAVPGIFTNLVTQTFMAIRCWVLVGRSTLFAMVISLGLLPILGTAIYGAFTYTQFYRGYGEPIHLFIHFQLLLWAAALVDLTITAVLVISLAKRRRESGSQQADSYLTLLIRLAFETCAVPTTFAITAAIVYCFTYRSPTTWNITPAIISPTPSIYVLAFVYCLEATERYSARAAAGASSGAVLAMPDGRSPMGGKFGVFRHGLKHDGGRGGGIQIATVVISHAETDVKGHLDEDSEDSGTRDIDAARLYPRPRADTTMSWAPPESWHTTTIQLEEEEIQAYEPSQHSEYDIKVPESVMIESRTREKKNITSAGYREEPT